MWRLEKEVISSLGTGGAYRVQWGEFVISLFLRKRANVVAVMTTY